MYVQTTYKSSARMYVCMYLFGRVAFESRQRNCVCVKNWAKIACKQSIKANKQNINKYDKHTHTTIYTYLQQH